jgi:SRSO17 transposase
VNTGGRLRWQSTVVTLNTDDPQRRRTVGVPADHHQAQISLAQPLPPKPWSGRGSKPARLRRKETRSPVSVKALALKASARRKLAWHEGTTAERGSRFASLRVRPAHRHTLRERTIRPGSMCSPLNTCSRRLRVASLAGTFFIRVLLSVGWIERGQASSP